MKQECAQTKRQSPDQDQHGPRGRAILPGQAERAFPGRPGPAQTESRALFPRQTGTSTDRVAAHLSQNGMSHPLGPFRGNASGMGAFGGPFSSQEGRQSRLSRNQWSQTRGHKGRPGPARTEGQSALSQADQDQPDQDLHNRVAEPSFPDMASTGVG